MDNSRLYVDFNELIDDDLVLLSQQDIKLDHKGNEITLFLGKQINVYMDDINENGVVDYLVASGTVELNNTGLFPICKWNLRINAKGIQHESDLEQNEK
ncbi:hypothetical protein CLU96_4213 [Chryseobacterium sp. 52]|uniref:hypothetical protein n=1 Tax=Chryseobacterium sp. 52 TaxID=2035213 RepID=UPI000C17ABF8|nr:hypothetical protein [Chryseobacterium sp. 52]PIF47165.1 hypothetical protein CLU96_4213 [Chryseobacterium sp. 52]